MPQRKSEKSVRSVTPRPLLPHRSSRTRVEPDSPPRRTYADVIATPSPEQTPAYQEKRHSIHAGAYTGYSRTGSVLELTDSSMESAPPVLKITKGPRPRVPTNSGGTMTTRALNGIVKKRILEDAAVFSDQELEFPVSPSKKPKLKRGAFSRSRSARKDISPVASDFPSSDDTPSLSVSPEKKSHDVPDVLSISPLKLNSGEKKEWYDSDSGRPSSELLPALELQSSPGPARQKRGSKFNTKLRESQVHHTDRTAIAHSPDSKERPPGRNSRGKARLALFVHPRSRTPSDVVSNEDDDESRSTVEISSKVGPSVKMKSTGSTSAALPQSPPLKLNSFEAALAKKGMKVRKALDKSSPIPKTQLLVDVNGHRVLTLPDVCEVTSPDLQDVLLEDDYAGLPKLSIGTFRSWNGVAGDGYVLFSGWATQLPDLDVNLALAAVRFTQHRQFVNMSRVSPMRLHTVNTAHEKSTLHVDQRMAVCLSSILVVESNLLVATDRGLKNKFIKGTLHQQEMQRLMGSTCMVFGHGPLLHAQIERDSMIFGTLGSWRSSDRKPEIARNIRHRNLLSKSPGSTKQILDVTDSVPIYDARGSAFNYSDHLENIDSTLTRFNGEIPAGSFAVVAYTMSTYRRGDDWHLNTNVQFVLVVKDFEG